MHIRKHVPFAPLERGLSRPPAPLPERAPERPPDTERVARSSAPTEDDPTPPTRTLVSSVRGELTKIIFAWPAELYVASTVPEVEQVRQASLRQIEVMLRTLPAGCEIGVVHPSKHKADAEALLAQHRPSGQRTLVAYDGPYTIWVQDPKVATEGATAVEPPTFFDPKQAAMMSAVLPAFGMTVEAGGIDLVGGNTLAGTKSWFVGADMLRTMARVQGEKEIDATKRHCKPVETKRVPVVIRSGVQPVPAHTIDGTDEIYAQNRPGTEQPLFHIDLFMSIATDKEDREVILIGSPREARLAMGDGQWPEKAGLEEHFESIAVALEELGFPVKRVPMPMFAVSDPKEAVKQWRFAPYNNVLVQDAPTRKVWLPTFGSDQWPEARKSDERNIAAWSALGYEVVQIPDCTALAVSFGGLHCQLLVLERRRP